MHHAVKTARSQNVAAGRGLINSQSFPEPSDSSSGQLRFRKSVAVKVRAISPTDEGVIEPPRKERHRDRESAKVQDPRPAMAGTTAGKFAGRNLRFARPIGFVLVRDVMQIVELCSFHPAGRVRKDQRHRFRFEPHPPRLVTASSPKPERAKKRARASASVKVSG